MSRKQVYGITLTDEERRMAGYGVQGNGWYAASGRAGQQGAQTGPLRTHTCGVLLPDGTPCQVQYERLPYSHGFVYGEPLAETIYDPVGVGGTAADIERRAQELVGRAWRWAQQKEQKQARQASAPPHLAHTLAADPPLRPRTAKSYAGLYAPCLRLGLGTLIPVGRAYEEAVEAALALAAMRQGGDARPLTVGLCYRWRRRWQVPRFLPQACYAAQEGQAAQTPQRPDQQGQAAASAGGDSECGTGCPTHVPGGDKEAGGDDGGDDGGDEDDAYDYEEDEEETGWDEGHDPVQTGEVTEEDDGLDT